jgi:hypothetical protein
MEIVILSSLQKESGLLLGYWQRIEASYFGEEVDLNGHSFQFDPEKRLERILPWRF